MRFVCVAAVMAGLSCAVQPPEGPIVHVQSKNVISRQLPPNVMLLVDRSASMAQPIDPSCTSSCRTRLSDVQAGMGEALAQHGSIAHWGLSVFPDAAACTVSRAGMLDQVGGSSLLWPADQQADADRVAARLGTVTVAGDGHPLGDALRLMGEDPELTFEDFQEDFVALITAGPSDCGADALQAVKDLRAKHLRTIVIGFGPETRTPAALASLDGMAEAGGFARTCPSGTDADCGPGGHCLAGGVCERSFFQVNDRSELRDAWLNITRVSGAPSDPCVFPLEFIPASPDKLTVLFDRSVIEGRPDTWTLGAKAVTFQGGLCQLLRDSTVMHPIEIEVRVVEP